MNSRRPKLGQINRQGRYHPNPPSSSDNPSRNSQPQPVPKLLYLNVILFGTVFTVGTNQQNGPCAETWGWVG